MAIFPLVNLNRGFGLLMFLLVLALVGCDEETGRAAFPGDPARGERLIETQGCGSCHQIPGISGAEGDVGPPLAHIKARAYLAGILPNSFDNLVLWLVQTQRIAPGSAMPDLGLTKAEAQDIAAYLYQLE